MSARRGITLYTSPQCPNCPRVKALLEEFCGGNLGYDLRVVNIAEADTLSLLQKGICSTPSAELDDSILFLSPQAPKTLEDIDVLLRNK